MLSYESRSYKLFKTGIFIYPIASGGLLHHFRAYTKLPLTKKWVKNEQLPKAKQSKKGYHVDWDMDVIKPVKYDKKSGAASKGKYDDAKQSVKYDKKPVKYASPVKYDDAVKYDKKPGAASKTKVLDAKQSVKYEAASKAKISHKKGTVQDPSRPMSPRNKLLPDLTKIYRELGDAGLIDLTYFNHFTAVMQKHKNGHIDGISGSSPNSIMFDGKTYSFDKKTLLSIDSDLRKEFTIDEITKISPSNKKHNKLTFTPEINKLFDDVWSTTIKTYPLFKRLDDDFSIKSVVYYNLTRFITQFIMGDDEEKNFFPIYFEQGVLKPSLRVIGNRIEIPKFMLKRNFPENTTPALFDKDAEKITALLKKSADGDEESYNKLILIISYASSENLNITDDTRTFLNKAFITIYGTLGEQFRTILQNHDIITLSNPEIRWQKSKLNPSVLEENMAPSDAAPARKNHRVRSLKQPVERARFQINLSLFNKNLLLPVKFSLPFLTDMKPHPDIPEIQDDIIRINDISTSDAVFIKHSDNIRTQIILHNPRPLALTINHESFYQHMLVLKELLLRNKSLLVNLGDIWNNRKLLKSDKNARVRGGQKVASESERQDILIKFAKISTFSITDGEIRWLSLFTGINLTEIREEIKKLNSARSDNLKRFDQIILGFFALTCPTLNLYDFYKYDFSGNEHLPGMDKEYGTFVKDLCNKLYAKKLHLINLLQVNSILMHYEKFFFFEAFDSRMRVYFEPASTNHYNPENRMFYTLPYESWNPEDPAEKAQLIIDVYEPLLANCLSKGKQRGEDIIPQIYLTDILNDTNIKFNEINNYLNASLDVLTLTQTNEPVILVHTHNEDAIASGIQIAAMETRNADLALITKLITKETYKRLCKAQNKVENSKILDLDDIYSAAANNIKNSMANSQKGNPYFDLMVHRKVIKSNVMVTFYTAGKGTRVEHMMEKFQDLCFDTGRLYRNDFKSKSKSLFFTIDTKLQAWLKETVPSIFTWIKSFEEFAKSEKDPVSQSNYINSLNEIDNKIAALEKALQDPTLALALAEDSLRDIIREDRISSAAMGYPIQRTADERKGFKDVIASSKADISEVKQNIKVLKKERSDIVKTPTDKKKTVKPYFYKPFALTYHLITSLTSPGTQLSVLPAQYYNYINKSNLANTKRFSFQICFPESTDTTYLVAGEKKHTHHYDYSKIDTMAMTHQFWPNVIQGGDANLMLLFRDFCDILKIPCFGLHDRYFARPEHFYKFREAIQLAYTHYAMNRDIYHSLLQQYPDFVNHTLTDSDFVKVPKIGDSDIFYTKDNKPVLGLDGVLVKI